MKSFAVNGDKLEIRKFENFLWRKEFTAEKLPEELKKLSGVDENIRSSGGWYYCENDEYVIYAFMSNIGTNPHPLIDISCVCTWYNSNSGGVYLTGRDKKTGAFFAPVMN